VSDLVVGRYRHYKGQTYSVIGVAQHSETGESLVVYRPEYGARGTLGSSFIDVSRAGDHV
jgi:hypothetical protein